MIFVSIKQSNMSRVLNNAIETINSIIYSKLGLEVDGDNVRFNSRGIREAEKYINRLGVEKEIRLLNETSVNFEEEWLEFVSVMIMDGTDWKTCSSLVNVSEFILLLKELNKRHKRIWGEKIDIYNLTEKEIWENIVYCCLHFKCPNVKEFIERQMHEKLISGKCVNFILVK